MIVYQVSREFYPFANAGGLKEVVTGIATGLSQKGHSSSVFIPFYGFNKKNSDHFLKKETFDLCIQGEIISISTYLTHYLDVDVYMFDFPSIANKNDVYTYTLEDEKINSSFKKGFGFIDTDRINITFQLAFLEYVTKYLVAPDILSLHDGHTGLIPAIIKSNDIYRDIFKSSQIYFTIHNAGYAYHQRSLAKSISDYNIIKKELLCTACFSSEVDPLCLAVLNAIAITVSPYYAKEILDLKHEELSDGFGKFCNNNNIKITGITNGVAIDHFKNLDIVGLPNVTLKKKFKLELSQDIKICKELRVWGDIDLIDRPLFIFQNRITEQKGIDKLITVLESFLVSNSRSTFVIMGQGEDRYEKMLIDLVTRSSSNVCYIQGYNEIIANKLFLASDFFILTSLWEPCGLTDFEAQLAGSIPIVHKTGGLQKVINDVTGFVYKCFSELENVILNCENLFYDDFEKIENIKYDAFKLIEDKYTWDKVLENEYLPIFNGEI